MQCRPKLISGLHSRQSPLSFPLSDIHLIIIGCLLLSLYACKKYQQREWRFFGALRHTQLTPSNNVCGVYHTTSSLHLIGEGSQAQLLPILTLVLVCVCRWPTVKLTCSAVHIIRRVRQCNNCTVTLGKSVGCSRRARAQPQFQTLLEGVPQPSTLQKSVQDRFLEFPRSSSHYQNASSEALLLILMKRRSETTLSLPDNGQHHFDNDTIFEHAILCCTFMQHMSLSFEEVVSVTSVAFAFHLIWDCPPPHTHYFGSPLSKNTTLWQQQYYKPTIVSDCKYEHNGATQSVIFISQVDGVDVLGGGGEQRQKCSPTSWLWTNWQW